jgi:hypothetical protein
MTISRSSTFFGTTTTFGDETIDAKVPLTESFSLELGDNAGATVFEILDSDSVQVASIDSNGVTTFTGGSFFADDVSIGFGNTAAAPNVQLAYDTSDANANMVKLGLPTGGAIDVPIVLVGLDSAIVGIDNTFGDGVTDPRLAIVSPDGTDFLIMTATDAGVAIDSNVGMVIGSTAATSISIGRTGTAVSVPATFQLQGSTATNAGSWTQEGSMILDGNNAEMFLIRKNDDGGDILTINTLNTALTASTAVPGLTHSSGTKTWAAGAILSQVEAGIQSPTYAFDGASTITAATTFAISGPPLVGANATITNAIGFAVGLNSDLTGNTTSAGANLTAFVSPVGIDDGIGAVTSIVGLNIDDTPLGTNLPMGNQTATLTNFFGLSVGGMTLESDTLVRTITNAASIYVNGPPASGGNITFTNEPYALWVDSGRTRFDGDVVYDDNRKVDMTTTPGLLEYGGSNTPGYISNLGIDLTAGVFSIVDAQGAALSANNPGWVSVQSTTAGHTVCLKATAATHVFNDDSHASSHLTNLGFGITEAVNWNLDAPWFLYAVNEDDTDGGLGFFISRLPNLWRTPAAGAIHDYDAAAGTDDQTSIFGMWNDDAGKAQKPCVLIGAFKMQWAAATTDWTVQAFNHNVGMGRPQIDKVVGTSFDFPTGQNGAASTTHLKANGGTAPIFTTNTYQYTIDLDGYCTIYINLNGDSGTDGVGAVTAQVSLPYTSAGVTAASYGMVYLKAQATGITNPSVLIVSGNSYFAMREAGAATNVENQDFTNGDRKLETSFSYKAF